MKKHLPTDAIKNELSGASAFFQRPAPPEPQPVPESPPPAAPAVQTPPPAEPAQKQDRSHENNLPPTQEVRTSSRHDVMIDFTTSLQEVDLKEWREQIENTETQNSALRLTRDERYMIEDVVSDLQRKERIKTSMNELARLGLLFLIQEFKKNRRKSIIYRVKKA